MKKTVQLFMAAAIGGVIFSACGESNDSNVNGPVLPDTTHYDSLNGTGPADGMGPNTGVADSNTIPIDSMKGTRGNSATDTTKPLK